MRAVSSLSHFTLYLSSNILSSVLWLNLKRLLCQGTITKISFRLLLSLQTDGNRRLRLSQIPLWYRWIWGAFCFHGFWISTEQSFSYCCTAVRLHRWLLTTGLSAILSPVSLVHCVVLDFCLPVSMTVHSTSGECAAACVRVVTLPDLACTFASHAV